MSIKGLNKFCKEMAAGQRAKGWEDRPIPEDIALIHSELSEALEEYRDGHPPTETYYSEDNQGYWKPEGIPSEMADTVIRIAAFCGIHGIDLEEAIRIKNKYNATRPMKHGRKVV